MNGPNLALKVKPLAPDVIIPEYQTAGAACFDLYMYGETTTITPGEAVVFDTKLAFEVPPGFVLLVFSRSGHGFKSGLRLSNGTGVIDSDYRGEVKVKLHNDGIESYTVAKSERIAQAMVVPLVYLPLVVSDSLSDTERGEGGFGSTGK